MDHRREHRSVRRLQPVARQSVEASGRATLAGSDSEGNLRARPSLNVPFPRKPPDLLMAESPPTGGLSAFKEPQSTSDQGTMSLSVTVKRSSVSSSSPSMCRRAGPVSVHRSRKYDHPGTSGSSDLVIASTR